MIIVIFSNHESMAKFKILIIITALALHISCGQNRDVIPDFSDSLNTRKDIKVTLSEIEDVYPGYDYSTVINEHSKILPEGMSVTKFRQFVIFSDLNEELTYSLIDNDVRFTIESMTSKFVNKTPDVVTPVYLFENLDKYKNFVLTNYDIKEFDISPYGFYKISKNVIVIRFVSWKGSIKHELTHRFIQSDFPETPSWFDEGFASLNEKSTFKEGALTGDFSFRIIPLRRALYEGSYTDLQHLMETNDDELYGKRTSYYYAQSRYLLMYLQQAGLLEKYYKYFRDNFKKDPSGIKQLQEITGKKIHTLDDELLTYIKSFKE